MAWTKIFRSHHTVYLEEQLEHEQIRHAWDLSELKRKHLEEIARIESFNLDARCEAMQRLADTKKAHVEELNRAIEENARLRDEVHRVRLYLTPGLQTISTEPDRSTPPSPAPDSYAGTPWQRILRRGIEEQEKTAAAHLVKPADAPVKGESNGNEREGRIEAPLGESSAPA